jgi:hypothetical protein
MEDKIFYQSSFINRTQSWFYPFITIIFHLLLFYQIGWERVYANLELFLDIKTYSLFIIMYCIAGLNLYSYSITSQGIIKHYNLFHFKKVIKRKEVKCIKFDDSKLKYMSKTRGVIIDIGIVRINEKKIFLNNNKEFIQLIKIFQDLDYQTHIKVKKPWLINLFNNANIIINQTTSINLIHDKRCIN